MRLTYCIKFVEKMDEAISFYRDTLGMPLRFQSPSWSEFETGDTTLALHLASPENPAGSVQLGLNVDDLQGFYDEKKQAGVTFTSAPEEVHGVRVARLLDVDGAEISVSGN